MYSGSIRSFPSYREVSSMLRQDLPKDLNTEDKEKVIKVVSRHFASQAKTKTAIRVESGLLLLALTGSLMSEDIDLRDVGMPTPMERVKLNQNVVNNLRESLLSSLLNASSTKS